MKGKELIRQAFQATLEARYGAPAGTAYLTRGEGDGTLLVDGGQDREVWMHRKDGTHPFKAYLPPGMLVPLRDGDAGIEELSVRLEHPAGQPGALVVKDALTPAGRSAVGTLSPMEAQVNRGYYTTLHQITTWSVHETRPVATTRVQADGSYAYVKPSTGTLQHVLGSWYLELSGLITALSGTGKHQLIITSTDEENATLVATAATAVTPTGSLPSRDEFLEADVLALLATLPATYAPNQAIYLYDGQTGVAQADIYSQWDLRLLFSNMRPYLPLTGGTLTGTLTATNIVANLYKLNTSTTLVESSDAITVSRGYHLVQSESGTTDNLATISGGSGRMFVTIQAAAGHTITVKNGTGNVFLNWANDLVLSGDRTLTLFYDGTNWADQSAIDLTRPGAIGGTTPDVVTAAINKLPASTELTESSDAITVTQGFHTVKAESGTADNLATINGGSGVMFVVLQAKSGHTITVKSGTGNINLNWTIDFILTGDKSLMLFYDGTNWSDLTPMSITLTGNTNPFLFTIDNNGSTAVSVDAYDNSSAPTLIVRRARGTKASPTQATVGAVLGTFGFRGYQSGGAFTNDRAGLYAAALEDLTSSAQGAGMFLEATPAGTTTIYDVAAFRPDYSQYISKDAATNTVTDSYFIHRTTGTPAAGFGHRHRFRLHASTNADQDAAGVTVVWLDPVSAQVKGKITIGAYDVTALRDGIAVKSDGTYGIALMLAGFGLKRISTAGNTTLVAGDCYLGVTSTASARTETLPAASACFDTNLNCGQVVIVKDESGAAATNNITVQRAGSDTIEGATSKAINTNYGTLRLMAVSTSSWMLI